MKKVQVKELLESNTNKNRQKYTNCFVTINTNKTNKELLLEFKQACKEIFNNIEHYIDYRDLTKIEEKYIDNISC